MLRKSAALIAPRSTVQADSCAVVWRWFDDRIGLAPWRLPYQVSCVYIHITVALLGAVILISLIARSTVLYIYITLQQQIYAYIHPTVLV